MARNARFVIVTGISGSGRSTCLHALEDLGFYCVDNLPTALLPALESMMAERLTATPVAVGIDIRAGELLGDVDTAIQALKTGGVQAELLFLDCADDVLIRRFAETRRKHPIWQAGTVSEAIRFELTERLKELDQVAYVRFASVYRRFEDLGDFVDELKELIGRAPARLSGTRPEPET